MSPIHDGLDYVAFPYPQLGPNTGVFDILDTPVVHYDEYADQRPVNNYIGYGDNGDINYDYNNYNNNYDNGGYYGGNDFLGYDGYDAFLG